VPGVRTGECTSSDMVKRIIRYQLGGSACFCLKDTDQNVSTLSERVLLTIVHHAAHLAMLPQMKVTCRIVESVGDSPALDCTIRCRTHSGVLNIVLFCPAFGL
jgi:hypothetical protein